MTTLQKLQQLNQIQSQLIKLMTELGASSTDVSYTSAAIDRTKRKAQRKVGEEAAQAEAKAGLIEQPPLASDSKCYIDGRQMVNWYSVQPDNKA